MSFDESNWKVISEVILKLLAHSDPNVRLEMYGCCHKYVVEILGIQQVHRKSVDSSKQLHFLCDTAVLIEIISHGAASLDKKVRISIRLTVSILLVKVIPIFIHFCINYTHSAQISCFSNIHLILTHLKNYCIPFLAVFIKIFIVIVVELRGMCRLHSLPPFCFNLVPVHSSTCIYIIVFVYLRHVIFSGNPFGYE
jgi:hypothetical protein